MIEGKSVFSHNIPAIAGGEPAAFVRALQDGGFERVGLKICDGDLAFVPNPVAFPKWGQNVKPELVKLLRDSRIKVDFWHFVYGGDPTGELQKADWACTTFQPDLYIWDSESAFENKTGIVDAKGTTAAEANARRLSKGLKAAHPNIPQALCTWALPKNPLNLTQEWHPVKVIRAWLETVNLVMPMMYWDGSTAAQAVAYLQTSLDIWAGICDYPIIPVGRAYTGDGGTIDPIAITIFGEKVKSWQETKRLPGISWWVLDEVYGKAPSWQALKATPKYTQPVPTPVTPPPQPALTDHDLLMRLVKAHPDLFQDLAGNQNLSARDFEVDHGPAEK